MAAYCGVLWIVLVFLNVALSQGKDGCRELDFLSCVKNKTFTGHVIQTSRILAPGLETCQHQCFLEDKCISYNLGPIDLQTRLCELSDDDHLTDPVHVVPKEGSEYCAVRNPCSSNPCHAAGELCVPDFSWDTFVCKAGRWSDWSPWSCFCPLTRTRVCKNPVTQETANDCEGKNIEEQECKSAVDITSCSSPLGMENREITDQQVFASTYNDPNTYAKFGRLNYFVHGTVKSGWCCSHPKAGEYLQVDLGSVTLITKIATQGRRSYSQWVTEYILSYSNDQTTWLHYKGDMNCTKHFVGNEDKNTVVLHELPVPIKTRYIRVVVKKWSGHPCMRMELYGCALP